MEKEHTQPERRPVLLFAFANDDRPGRRLDGLRGEIEAIRRALTPAERQGLCEVVVRESTTPDELVDVLEDPRYRSRLALIHFAGHAGESRLLLEGNGEPVAARIQGLAPLLGELDNLAMLFLNGCTTREQGQRLIEEGIPAVIATEHTVVDTQAERFAADFYRALASGTTLSESFERALSQARCFTPRSGAARDLVPSPRVGDLPTPWRLLLAEPRGDAKDWSLPAAARDPLFGLPAPVGGMLPQEPFMGLRRFRAQDSTVFFGRGWAIRNLYQDVLDPKMPPVLVVYGASGVGKSSLLEAGLLPRVAATHETHELRLERKQDPEQMLRRALGGSPGHADLAEAWRAREEVGDRPVVICLDQLEALVLEGGKPALARFIDALAPLYDGDGRPRGKLVLGLRKEWFPELRNELRRHGMAWHEHFVEPLGRADIEEIILGVTRTASMRARYGITYDDGLAARIANDLSQDRESAIAPMLQILLTRMWARTGPRVTSTDGRLSRQFSMETYDELRRDGLALSDFVERQLESLGETHSEELASGLVLDLLMRHTTSRGTAEVCTHATLRALYAHQRKRMESLVERCIELYLLQPVAGDRGGDDGVRLAHDTLAPIVRDRHARSKAPGQAAARLLDARMGMAETSGRSRLLDEHDLEEVEAAQGGMRRWTEAEQHLVAASRRRRARGTWLRRGRQVLVVGSVGSAVVVVATQRLQPEPEPEAMVFRSETHPKTLPLGPPPSFVAPRPQALPDDTTPSDARPDDALRAQAPPAHVDREDLAADDTKRSAWLDEVGTAPSPSVRTPAAAKAKAKAERTTPVPRCPARILRTGHTGGGAEVGVLAATANGARLAAGMEERNKAFVFEPLDPASTLSPIPTGGHVNAIAWSPDAERLAIGQEGGIVQLVRWDGGTMLIDTCEAHSTSVRALAFSRDGTILVTGDIEGHVFRREGRSCKRKGRILELGDAVYAASEGDGSAWVVAGSGGHWTTWAGAKASAEITGDPLAGGGVIRRVLARPGGQWIFVAGRHLYSWSTSEPEVHRSSGSSHGVIFWAFDAEDGGMVLTAGRDAVDLWSHHTGSWTVVDTEPIASIEAVAASYDRRDVFVADSTGAVQWLRHEGRGLSRVRAFEISADRLSSIAVDPQRRYVAVGDHGGNVTTITLPSKLAAASMCEPRPFERENPPPE